MTDRRGKCKFQKWQSQKNRNYYWRLKSTLNGKTIAIAGEGFTTSTERDASMSRLMDYLDSPLSIPTETIADPNA